MAVGREKNISEVLVHERRIVSVQFNEAHCCISADITVSKWIQTKWTGIKKFIQVELDPDAIT